MLRKNVLIIGVPLLLVACATAQPFQVSGGQQVNALVEGDSGALGWLPGNHNLVSIEAVNGKKIGASEVQVLLPPGKYTFNLHCEIDATMFGNQFYPGDQDLTFNVEAGHIYKFIAELAHHTRSGNSYFTKMYNNEKVNSCAAFAYDATGSAGPYPETVHVVNPPNAGSQWKASGQAYGGHSIQDWVPELQSEKYWSEMIEIEYWSKLMYPQTADELFHSRVASAMKQCPGTQMKVLSESTNQIVFELKASTCAANKVRVQLSRFMTGEYGVYEISYLSINPLNDADRTAWLQALQNAKTVIQD